MAPLIVIPCPTCGGDAYLEDERGAARCVTCNASGQLEVCEGCNEVPTVQGGVDACGCATGLWLDVEVLADREAELQALCAELAAVEDAALPSILQDFGFSVWGQEGAA